MSHFPPQLFALERVYSRHQISGDAYRSQRDALWKDVKEVRSYDDWAKGYQRRLPYSGHLREISEIALKAMMPTAESYSEADSPLLAKLKQSECKTTLPNMGQCLEDLHSRLAELKQIENPLDLDPLLKQNPSTWTKEFIGMLPTYLQMGMIGEDDLPSGEGNLHLNFLRKAHEEPFGSLLRIKREHTLFFATTTRDVNALGVNGFTRLDTACMGIHSLGSDPFTVEYLITLGADPNQRSTDGSLPTSRCCLLSDAQSPSDPHRKAVLRLLLEKIDFKEFCKIRVIEEQGRSRETSDLNDFFAHQGFCEDSIVVLDYVDAKTPLPNGQTMLHLAARVNGVALAQALIEKGADPKIRDKEGNTFLHVAAQKNASEVIRLFFPSQ